MNLWAVLSHLLPRFVYILDQYGHARSRRRASARRGEALLSTRANLWDRRVAEYDDVILLQVRCRQTGGQVCLNQYSLFFLQLHSVPVLRVRINEEHL